MIKRKILDPLRFVFEEDTAVASNGAQYQEYLEGACDWDKLTLVEGEQPTVFVLQQMTHRQKLARESYPEGFAQAVFTVRCGLARVENYWIERGDGSVEQVDTPDRKKVGDMGSIVSEDWIESAGLTMNQIGKLSIAIMGISEANVPLLKRCGSAYGVGG